MSFNLDAPLGFRGLDFDKPIEVYSRNLPHWRQQGATYFVTFGLADCLPGPKKEELKCMRRIWEIQNPLPRNEETWTQYAKTIFITVEKWMDAGYGKCWFASEIYANELHRSILHFHQQHYEIGCFVIMANHCHLTIRPFENSELEQEIGAIKSVTSHFINKTEQINGPLWQPESYDRIIRDEEHLYRVVQYIGSNPRRAGIPPNQWHRWLNPQWIAQGWVFDE